LQAPIYHGLPEDLFRFYPDRGDYLAFLGQISPEKGADRAIEIAKRVGMPLKMQLKSIGLTDAISNALSSRC